MEKKIKINDLYVKLFIKFLKVNKCYKQFFENNKLGYLPNYNSFIKASFVWSETKEGHYFWGIMHLKWKRIVEMIETYENKKLKYNE